MKGLSKYLGLVGVALFAGIVLYFDPQKIIASLLRTNLLLFALGVLALLPLLFLKALKAQLLLKPVKGKISLAKSAEIWAIGFFFGLLSPGKVGDFLRAVYLNKETPRASRGQCLSAVFVERLLDMATLFLMAFAGLAAFSLAYNAGNAAFAALGAGFIAFVCAIFFISRKKFMAKVAKPFFGFLVPEKFKATFRESFHDFYEGMKSFGREKQVTLFVALLTIITWLAAIGQYYIIALAVHINVSYFFLLMVLPAAFLLESLPISFSGLGTREAILIFFLSFAGIPAQQAISFSLGVLATNLALGLLGLVLFNARQAQSGEKNFLAG
ncbi:MAG: flippase-like domain-containing protein [Candidatus Diapherotrites archaeon]|nr:flippase-like domain-containing protein [Candidatus Diapherotrites archaeon]